MLGYVMCFSHWAVSRNEGAASEQKPWEPEHGHPSLCNETGSPYGAFLLPEF